MRYVHDGEFLGVVCDYCESCQYFHREHKQAPLLLTILHLMHVDCGESGYSEADWVTLTDEEVDADDEGEAA